MRRRLLILVTLLAAMGIALPSVIRAEASPSVAAGAAIASSQSSINGDWCPQTFLDPGHCIPTPCIGKYCPEAAVTPAAAGSSAAPRFVCADGFEVLCQVVGLVFCRKPFSCPTAAATAARAAEAPRTAAVAATPNFQCARGFEVICQAAGLVLCRKPFSCPTVAATPVRTAAAASPRVAPTAAAAAATPSMVCSPQAYLSGACSLTTCHLGQPCPAGTPSQTAALAGPASRLSAAAQQPSFGVTPGR